MDKQLLRPCELHFEPQQPDAASVFNFWLRTVEDFISTLQELRRDDDPEVNKKRVMITVFLLLSTLTSKQRPTIWSFRFRKFSMFKKKNNVHAWHLLESRRHSSDESISAFLHVLAKDCAFSDVTADKYREERARDAFINGFLLLFINVYFKKELSLNQAFELADNLDRAHHYSSCKGPLVPDQSLSMMTSDSTAKNSGAAASTRRSSSSVVKAVSCFFCGLDQGFSNFLVLWSPWRDWP